MTNLVRIVRSEQEFSREKNQKKARIGRCHPYSALPGSRALERGGSQNGDALK
jgi:hypothetical protein